MYAADKLYKDGGNVTTTTTSSSATEITELTVGGVTIGGSGSDDGKIIAKNIVGSTNASAGTLSDININGATFASGGAITANGGLTTNSVTIGGLTISSVASSSTTSAAIDISGTKFESSGAITANSLSLNGTDVKAAIEAKAAKTDVEINKNAISTLEQTVGNASSGLVKDVADNKVAIAANTTALDAKADKTDLNTANDKITALEGKTTKISYDSTNEITTVDGVTFKAGAVSGVKSINDKIKFANDGTVTFNDKIKISADSTTVTFNEGKPNGQVQISENGIKVGTGSTYIKGDAIYTGDANYDNAKAGMKSDGSLKAANGVFKVDTAGKVTTTSDITGQNITANGALKGASLDVTGDISTNGSVTAKGGLSAANGNFTVEGTTGNTAVGGTLDVTGAATLGRTLDVTGAATLGSTLDVTGAATFGTVAGSQTVINGGDITADGNVTAKGGLSAANNAFKVDGTNGDISTDGNLVVKQKITGQSLKIGTTGDEFTVDALGNVVAKGQLTAKSATIGTVGITDTGVVTGVSKLTTANLEVTGVLNISGDIAAKNISGDSLTVNGAIKGASLDVTGAVTGATINGATITTNSFNGATIGATTFNGVTLTTDGDVNGRNMTASGTIKGNEITDGAGASMKAGTVTGTKITDGAGFTATGGDVTAKDINATTGTIAGVGFASNNVSGINNLTATGTIQGATLKVNDHNLLNSNGLKADSAVIDDLTIDGASITSNNADGSVGVAGITVDKTGAITGVKAIDGVAVAGNAASGLTIGSGATAVTIGGNSLALSSTGFNVDDDGDVTGKSFKVNGSNYLDSTGLTTGKAVIGGVNTLNDKGIDTSKNLHVGGQATFGDSTGTHTTINGGTITSTDGTDSTTIGPNKITTKTLEADTIILNDHMQDGAGNKIEIGADGHLNVAGNNFTIDTIGQLTNEYTGTDAAGRATKTTLKTSVDGINANYTNSVNNNNNLLNINQDGVALGVTDSSNNNLGMLSADKEKATMGYGTANSIVVGANTIESKVGTDASRTLKANEIVDAAGGMTITTNNTGTTFSDGTTNTLIKGSSITSTNGTATGVLNGSNLTLTNGANSTALTAGGVTFTGADGRSDATGVKNQTTIDGGIITTDTLNVQRIELGDKLVDSNGTSHGSNLSMDEYGNIKAAGGKFTVAGTNQTNSGALHNEVGKTSFDTTETGASMKFDTTTPTGGIKSEVSVADGKAEMAVGANAAVTATDGKVEIKGGTQTVTTTNDGTVFENSAHNTPFGGGSETKTTINGNEITTGKITTDQLVIKGNGQGAAAGAGTGSIALGGNGSIKSNIQNASGTKEATFETEFDHIKSEVTDGTTTTKNEVKASGNTNTVTEIATSNNTESYQTATSIGGVVTNGTVTMKQELTAEGVKVTDELGDPANYTQITDKDVSITDPKNAGKRINLSDLGQLNDLDGELTARSEYTSNPTAVGAINAEAGIRREEIARLDNRIDDVNNRVDKVGAMAAAIASLKSIGYDPQAPSEFSIGLGQYKGETGVAMGFFHYPNKNFMINVSLSTAGGETMGGIGATWRFGHKSPQKLLEEQREAQARKELAAAEKYQAAAKLAKEAQERAEYAAKLARQAQVSADNAKAAADATQAKHFQ